ncbi:hypothetical protein K490DRAFT_11069, partial [Saccharata proteae CBS 121410]
SVTITSTRRPSVDSARTPRTARFAEATSVYSPVEPRGQSPFSSNLATNHYQPQPQPADVGFGYLSDNNSRHTSYRGSGVEMEETDRKYLPPPTPASPLRSPLKSALKSPGQPPRDLGNILSPTFREEQVLDKTEEYTEKEQAKDLKIKTRVRVAKVILRGINFSCSLIVLAMLAATFSIFNATKSLPTRNNLPPWAVGTSTWPQIVLLVIACVSLAMSVVILYSYWKGGHKRAEKVAVYYTVFAVGFYIFSIIMWAIGAGILNQAKVISDGNDIWGWSCKDNKRRELFEGDIEYGLVCRLQDWSLVCCVIEVIVETLTIIIYAVVFYRFYSKRRLRKSMAIRDRARSDLYLAQLRSQSAPNTPGFGPPPLTPGDGWKAPPGHPRHIGHAVHDPTDSDEEAEIGTATQFPKGFAAPKPFTLQPPPIRIQAATPKTNQHGFDAPQQQQPLSPSLVPERRIEHVPAAPGEVQYAAVPIPGAY